MIAARIAKLGVGAAMLCLISLLSISPAHAAEPSATVDISGSIGAASDYRFRGISLSDGDPSIQAGASASHKSGFYAGVAAYSLAGFGELGGSNLELDLYAGYRRRIGPVTAEGGILYYAYPGSSGGDFEFLEPYASLSVPIKPATVKLSAAFAPSQKALAGQSNIYLAAEIIVPLQDTPVTLKGRLGRSDGDTPLTPGGGYTEWLIGADYVWRRLTVGLAATGTNIKTGDALAVGARRQDVRPTLLLSSVYSF
jgi:uncharacterized protein (TIGR02001 family)